MPGTSTPRGDARDTSDDAASPVEGRPRPPRRFSLAWILALLALATTVPVGSFAVRLILEIREDQVSVVDRQNVETARAISSAIDQEIRGIISALRLVTLLELLTEQNGDLTRLENLLLRLIPQQEGWRGLILVERSGRVLLDTRVPRGQPPGEISAPWFRRAVSENAFVVSDLLADAPGDGYYVVVAVPVQRKGEVTAVLGAAIRSTSISNIVRRQTPPSDGVVTLIDAQQRIIARTRGEAQYLGGPPAEDFQEASRRMSEGAWRATLLEGMPAYAALSRSSLTGWTVGLGIAREAIDGPIRRSILALAGLGLATLVIGIAAALLLVRMVVDSLRAGADGAHALARGEPLPLIRSRISEIGELQRGLQQAEEILRNRLDELERVERERSKAAAEREAALLAERAALQARGEDEARFAVTLQSIGDAVIATGASGHVTVVNPVAQILTGWSEAEALGRPVDDIFEIQDESTGLRLETPVNAVLREGRVVDTTHQTVLVSRHGNRTPVEDSAAPIRGPSGTLLGVVLVFRDVTQRREAERRQAALLDKEQEARLEAEALSRSKDEFVATVSHELRSPLNAIFGWARLLRSGSLDPATAQRALDVIERNTRAQAQLIDDLLDMSRIIAGKLRLRPRTVELERVLEAALDSIRPAADAKRIQIELRTQDTPLPVWGDFDRLQQILWNLLTNAIKFTPDAGRVEVTAWRDDTQICVSVRDTGVGIARELLPHVFQRFRQGTSSDTREHGGLGIGLALVRNLTELHGGKVTAESAGPGRGATFHLRLPCASSERRATEMRQVGEPAEVGELETRLDGLHVLLVDDDADVREILGTTLHHAGARCTPASSLRDAIQLFGNLDIDIVVSDIAMPHGSGYTLAKQLRSTERGRTLPIIALTAYARVEDRERALEAGFDVHIGKPVEPGRFLHLVAVVHQARQRRELDESHD